MDKDLLMSWIDAGTLQVPSLLMEHYLQLGLHEKEVMLILHISNFQAKGLELPSPEDMSGRMSITSGECSAMLRKLIQQEIITIEEVTLNGIRYEKYSLAPLWMKLLNIVDRGKREAELKSLMADQADLYTIFEQEFGRPLSPIECETLAMWIDQDHQHPSLIMAALREAVLSAKISFRYIDRILFEWKKNGIQTVEQARVHSMKFRTKPNQPAKQPAAHQKDVPFYNWLEQ